MARLPALATSLAVHAAAFAAVVLVPIFGTESLPEKVSPPSRIPEWPMSPPVVLADSRPAPARRVVRTPRAPSANPAPPDIPGPPPVANTFDPTAPPTDPGAHVCDRCAPGDNDEPGPGTGGLPDSTGTGLGGDSGGRDGEPLHMGGQIHPPAKLRHVNPEYPELARRAGIRGDVVVECLIDASGRITDVRVLSGHPLLAPAAVSAVSRWLYSPTRLNGVAVPVFLTVTVRFNLGR
jgi:periplasmic protein TonB